MGWSYVTTFTGVGEIPFLPAAAVDAQGNPRVLWAAPDRVLRTMSASTATPQKLATAFSSDISGSVCMIPAGQQPLLVWPAASQAIYCGLLPTSIPGGVLDAAVPGGATNDGPMAIMMPEGTVFVAWRGAVNDQSFYYSVVVNAAPPLPSSTAPFTLAEPIPFNSLYSPAIASLPSGGMAICWVGAYGDSNLYFATSATISPPALQAAGPLQYTIAGGIATATASQRPALALQQNGAAGTLVLVYQNMAQVLAYLVGTIEGDHVNWTAPVQDGAPDGTVPLGSLLATAGPNGSPVTIINPVAVWAAAPAATLYLLMGDQAGGSIQNSLYLVKYTAG